MRFLFFYLMTSSPDRVREIAPRHAEYWKQLALPGYILTGLTHAAPACWGTFGPARPTSGGSPLQGDLMREAVVEKVSWLVLGGTAFVAALFAGRSRRALYVARGALGILYIASGALVNAAYLATGTSYSGFADSAHVAFVRDTWESLVVPNQYFFIGLLIAFEATVGVLIIRGGRSTQIGLWGALLMHVGLLPFGWIITVWSLFMLVVLVLLLRAERASREDGGVQRHHSQAKRPVRVPSE